MVGTAANRVSLADSSQVEQGVGGGPCPSGGVPSFQPQVISGTDNNAAGSYSPFYLRILRRTANRRSRDSPRPYPPG